MTDQAFTPLLGQLSSNPDGHRQRALWFADESHDVVIDDLAMHRDSLTLISNRFDVAQLARKSRIESIFSDWVIPAELLFDRVFLRVSKEKAVTQHLLNLAFSRLPAGGELFLSGYKDEGIKTYAQKAKMLFNSSNGLIKDGRVYFLQITKQDISPARLLDDQDYRLMRPVLTLLGHSVLSKPGVYGWDKVDHGSALLVEALMRTGELDGRRVDSLLDLGCGYGYLTLATSAFPISSRVATDNNAGAIACMQANAKEFGISVAVIAADSADRVDGSFDLILCNPPFHKGFDIDANMHQKFLKAAAQKLNSDGAAYFVVNSFLPLEKAAKRFFGRVDCLTNDGRFKIVRLALGPTHRDSRNR